MVAMANRLGPQGLKPLFAGFGDVAAEQFAEKVRNLSFRTSAVFAEVRNLLCFQQEQIPHGVYPGYCRGSG
jgi:hypothetical protein